MTDTLTRARSIPEGPLPPQTLDAERSVLAAMLLDHESIGRALELLEGTSFYRVAHQKVFDAIVTLYNRNERADLVTVAEELRKRGDLDAAGGPPGLSQIMEQATTSANLEEHARLVNQKSLLRSLIHASGEIQQECYSDSDETTAILDRAEQRIFSITDRRVRASLVPLRELLKPAFEQIQSLYERKAMVTGVPSGYDDLDRLTAGFQPGDLVIIAGRPSMGKSSLAVNIAENAAIQSGVPVAIFSLEMSKEQLVLRMLGSQAEVSLSKIRNGYLAQEDWPRLTTGAGLLTQAPIMIDDSASLTVFEIRAKCRRLKAEGKLGLIVIDYLQLIRGSGRTENRVQEISQITRNLKALAKELNAPIIALSQLSRAVEQRGSDRRPQLSDLRESGCLTGDTRIWRADTGAEVSMAELLLHGERNIPVWTVDEEYRLVKGTMTHVFASGVKPVFKLILASGRSVKASANHPFLTFDGWKKLESLKAGDRLAIPRCMPTPMMATEWPESEVVMLAHMLGDGCFASRQPVHYTSSDEENLNVVETAAGLRSYEKFIPREVFGLSDSQVALFIRHLWATDGNLSMTENASLASMYYSSSSLRLIIDLQSLLQRFEIVGRVRTVPKAGYRPSYHLSVYGAEQQIRFLEMIGVQGSRGQKAPRILEYLRSRAQNTNVDTVPREVWNQVKSSMTKQGVTARALAAGLGMAYCGSTLYKHSPSRGRLARVAAILEDPELHQLSTSHLFWDAIAAIEPLGEEPVFDATVPGTHNFIADGIVAHNSVEQDSDVVMFVYREEYYKPDDPALKGKATIIIGKQRNGPTADVTLTFLRECTKFVPYSPIQIEEGEPGF